MRKKSKKRNKMIGVALVIIVLLFGIITVKFIQYEKIIEDTERTWLITQYGPRDVNSMFYTLYGGKGQLSSAVATLRKLDLCVRRLKRWAEK